MSTRASSGSSCLRGSFEHLYEYNPGMRDMTAPAILALPAAIKVEVRIVRWWWTSRATGTWAADIEIPEQGLVSGIPGEWLHRAVESGDPVGVPKNRRGRVSVDRSSTIGERLAQVRERDLRGP